MEAHKIKGDPIDLTRYPDDTELVLIALNDDEVERRQINGTSIPGLSRKEIADETSLTKSQVRTRVKKLTDNEHLNEQVPYPDRTRPTKYYKMEPRAKMTAWAFELGEEVLGGIPEEPTRQDMIDILGRIAKNENKIEKIRRRVGRAKSSLDEW